MSVGEVALEAAAAVEAGWVVATMVGRGMSTHLVSIQKWWSESRGVYRSPLRLWYHTGLMLKGTPCQEVRGRCTRALR